MVDTEAHVDTRFSEFELINDVRCVKEASLLITKFLRL